MSQMLHGAYTHPKTTVIYLKFELNWGFCIFSDNCGLESLLLSTIGQSSHRPAQTQGEGQMEPISP